MSSSMSPSLQCFFEDSSSSSSSDDSDIEDLILNNNVKNLMLILAVKELEDMESDMSEEEQHGEPPMVSSDPIAADVVDTGAATHAHCVQELNPSADGNEPTADDNDLQKKLIAGQERLHSGTEISCLSLVKQLMETKARHNMSDKSIDALLKIVGGFAREGHKVPANVHECQNLLTGLKIPSFKADGGTSSKRKRSRVLRK